MNLSNLLKYFNKYKFSIKKSIYINTDVLNSSVIRQKGESQNGCFKKTKQCQIFQKTNISHPLTRTHTSAYQGVRNVRFSEIWLAFFSWNTRFEIRPFVLLPTNYSNVVTMKLKIIIPVSPSNQLNYVAGTMLIITRASTSVYLTSILLLVVEDWVF